MHKPRSRCKITYYCSVRCQKQHWKVGGHKKRCVPKEDRSVLSAGRQSSKSKAGGGSRRRQRGDKDNECAICLEDLDDPEFGGAQILDCTHRFHRAWRSCGKEAADVSDAARSCQTALRRCSMTGIHIRLDHEACGAG